MKGTVVLTATHVRDVIDRALEVAKVLVEAPLEGCVRALVETQMPLPG